MTLGAMPARAGDTTSTLQVLPDSALRGLAAASAGLGTGFFLAGLPRLVVVAAMVPGLAAGAAIVSRPLPRTPWVWLFSPARESWRPSVRRRRPA